MQNILTTDAQLKAILKAVSSRIKSRKLVMKEKHRRNTLKIKKKRKSLK